MAKTKPTTKKPPKGGVDPRQQQRTDIRSATASKYTQAAQRRKAK